MAKVSRNVNQTVLAKRTQDTSDHNSLRTDYHRPSEGKRPGSQEPES